MPSPRRLPSVESFGPELLTALVKASREEVRIELPYRAAISLAQRLNKLRHTMEIQQHELFRIVARVRITILWGEKAGLPPVEAKRSSKNVPRPLDTEVPSILVLVPHDNEFMDALHAAGIKAHELQESALHGTSVDEILTEFPVAEVKENAP